jgi:hypothetical protein
MPRTSLSLPEFIKRWKASELSERSAAQSHFNDLCEVLGQPHPAAADQTGDTFATAKPSARKQARSRRVYAKMHALTEQPAT